VDVVGPQALEGLGERDLDVLRGQPGATPQRADLGGDHDVRAVAPGLHPLPEHALRLPTAVPLGPDRVEVRGIDDVPAGGDEGVEDGERLVAVRGPAEGVAAEAERERVDVGAGMWGMGLGASSWIAGNAGRGDPAVGPPLPVYPTVVGPCGGQALAPWLSLTALRISSTRSLASPKSIWELSRKNSGFCTPAYPA